MGRAGFSGDFFFLRVMFVFRLLLLLFFGVLLFSVGEWGFVGYACGVVRCF